MIDSQLDELAYGWLDQALDAPQQAEFEARLLASDAARERYLRLAAFHGFALEAVRLKWNHLAASEARLSSPESLGLAIAIPSGVQPSANEMRAQPPVLGFVGSALHVAGSWLSSPKALALMVLTGLLTYFAVLTVSLAISRARMDDRNHVADRPERVAEAARVLNATACRWEDPAIGTTVGTKIPAGNPRLAAGALELEFACGARVRIEGPAQFKALSERRLELVEGRIAAFVPKRARGFAIETPTAEIVDLGTEFGLDVDRSGNAEVHVVRGLVRVTTTPVGVGAAKARTGQMPIELSAGEALAVSRTASGDVVTEPTPFDATRIQQVARPGEPAARPHTTLACWASPNGLAGNQSDFRGGLGFDFRVIRPIRIFRLGVFDHLGDGIDPHSPMTVQLWSRDRLETDDTGDDEGRRVLAEAAISSQSPGELRYCHRFVPLAEPIDLPPGEYSLLAYGFSETNRLVNFVGQQDYKAHLGVSTFHGAIVPVGSRFDDQIQPGTFPKKVKFDQMIFIACSFEFAPLEDQVVPLFEDQWTRFQITPRS